MQAFVDLVMKINTKGSRNATVHDDKGGDLAP